MYENGQPEVTRNTWEYITWVAAAAAILALLGLEVVAIRRYRARRPTAVITSSRTLRSTRPGPRRRTSDRSGNDRTEHDLRVTLSIVHPWGRGPQASACGPLCVPQNTTVRTA